MRKDRKNGKRDDGAMGEIHERQEADIETSSLEV